MSGELEVFPNRTVVAPHTGEVIDLDDLDTVAAWIDQLRAHESQVRELKRLLTARLVDHTTTVGERTTVLPGGRKIIRTGGPVTEYDDLVGLERELLDAGCPAARVATIVVTTIDKKVNGVEAAKAARANPEYGAIIERHARKVERPYTITLG